MPETSHKQHHKDQSPFTMPRRIHQQPLQRPRSTSPLTSPPPSSSTAPSSPNRPGEETEEATDSSPTSDEEMIDQVKDFIRQWRWSDSAKLKLVWGILSLWRWSFKILFEKYFEFRLQFPHFWANFRKFAWTSDSMAYSELQESDFQSLFASSTGWHYISEELGRELDNLTNTPAFARFNVDQCDQILQDLQQLGPAIEGLAPHLGYLLRQLGRPVHSKKEESGIQSKHIFILSILCMSRHRVKSNTIPTAIGLYLMDSGASKRTINTLQQCGACPSYSTLFNIQTSLADKARKEVRKLALARNDFVVSWDNFEYQDTKAQERIGSQTKFESITTAMACIGVDFPATGLQKSMLRPHMMFDVQRCIRSMLPETQILQV